METATHIRRLVIKPEGETQPWTFDMGSYCGRAKDSVGISFRGMGCVLLREDVHKLITFLQIAAATWSEPAKDLS